MQFLEQTLKKQYQSWYVSILLNTWPKFHVILKSWQGKMFLDNSVGICGFAAHLCPSTVSLSPTCSSDMSFSRFRESIWLIQHTMYLSG